MSLRLLMYQTFHNHSVCTGCSLITTTGIMFRYLLSAKEVCKAEIIFKIISTSFTFYKNLTPSQMWTFVWAKVESSVLKCNEHQLKVQMLSLDNENYMYICSRQIKTFAYSSSFYRNKLLHNVLTVKEFFNTCFTVLYLHMFWAISCSSSGGQTVLI